MDPWRYPGKGDEAGTNRRREWEIPYAYETTKIAVDSAD
jgi:hypothetical protein